VYLAGGENLNCFCNSTNAAFSISRYDMAPFFDYFMQMTMTTHNMMESLQNANQPLEILILQMLMLMIMAMKVVSVGVDSE
jgi:hypothetical protein